MLGSRGRGSFPSARLTAHTQHRPNPIPPSSTRTRRTDRSLAPTPPPAPGRACEPRPTPASPAAVRLAPTRATLPSHELAAGGRNPFRGHRPWCRTHRSRRYGCDLSVLPADLTVADTSLAPHQPSSPFSLCPRRRPRRRGHLPVRRPCCTLVWVVVRTVFFLIVGEGTEIYDLDAIFFLEVPPSASQVIDSSPILLLEPAVSRSECP